MQIEVVSNPADTSPYHAQSDKIALPYLDPRGAGEPTEKQYHSETAPGSFFTPPAAQIPPR